MRKYLIVLAVALMPALVMPPAASAATKPTEQEMLVVKKKKAEAARKAEARKLDDKRKADAARKAKQLDLRKAKAEARRKVPVRRVVERRSCGGFLNCLFGNKPRSGVQRASTGGMVNDYATAETVNWNDGKYSAGSIIVRTPERALYLVLGDGRARRYKVGVGREGFQWSGTSRIVNKAEWPTWRPPQVMIEREAAKGHMLPEVMAGGPENPLGARAMYIGGTLFRIHGTNNSSSIGGAVSSGCIRMMNTDVMDLYDRVNIGAKVYVYQ
jgi:lipoprotein-anchoring transpeptidase ErfK/SrfK